MSSDPHAPRAPTHTLPDAVVRGFFVAEFGTVENLGTSSSPSMHTHVFLHGHLESDSIRHYARHLPFAMNDNLDYYRTTELLDETTRRLGGAKC